MAGRILSEINLGRVVIGSHLKTKKLQNKDKNNNEKKRIALAITEKCRDKGWDVIVHEYPQNGYCSELDGNWAYPISIKATDEKNDTSHYISSVPEYIYTYVIFSLSDLADNYGAPFYNRNYVMDSNMNHLPISEWSKFDEFTDIVKAVFGECESIDKYVTTE